MLLIIATFIIAWTVGLVTGLAWVADKSTQDGDKPELGGKPPITRPRQ
jgi:hypothetical protein